MSLKAFGLSSFYSFRRKCHCYSSFWGFSLYFIPGLALLCLFFCALLCIFQHFLHQLLGSQGLVIVLSPNRMFSLYKYPNLLITALTESHIAPNSEEEERKSDLAYATSFFFSFFLLLLNFSSFFVSSCYSHWVLMAQLTTLLMSLLTLFLSTPGK